MDYPKSHSSRHHKCMITASAPMEPLFRRAELFARLLQAFTPTWRSHIDEAILRAASEWHAASLLGAMLHESNPAHPVLDRATAAAMLGVPSALDDLEGRHLVGWILGRMQIAPGARMAVANIRNKTGPEDGAIAPLDTEILEALEVLVGAWNLREREPLAIPTDLAEKLRDNHASAHPATPSFEDLLPLLGLRRDGDVRLVLRPPDHFVDAAAAELWLTLMRAQPGERGPNFDAWFSRVGVGAIGAPSHLPPSSRSALLDEMLVRVLGESSLGKHADEWARALVSREDLGGGLGDPPSYSDDDDAADLRQWWIHVEKLVGEPGIAEMRDDISALVGAIIRHDSLDGAFRDRGARIIRLLEHSRSAVFLGAVTPSIIARQRPEAIAILLIRSPFQRLGLALLGSIQIDDDATAGWTDEQQLRRERRVRLAWSEGLGLALDVISGMPPEESAARLAKLVLPLADAATADITYSVQRQPRADAEARLAETLALLETLRVRTTAPDRARLLPKLATSFVGALEAQTPVTSLPSGALKLLFWLRSASSVAASTAALRLLCKALMTESDRGWSHDHSDAGRLEWDRVVREADDGAFDWLVTLEPWRSDPEAWAGTNRERLYFRILAKAHSGLAQRQVPSPELQTRRSRLETRIRDRLTSTAMLGKYDPANPFGRLMDGSSFGPNVEDLTFAIAQAVDAFEGQVRDSTIDAWLGKVDDPVLLVRAAAAMHASRARDVVAGRLAEMDLGAALKDESTVSVAAMASDALTLGSGPLVERLLAAGDSIFGGRLKARWEEDSLTPRLAYAALRGDQPSFDALASTSRDTHDFQRGLLALRLERAADAVATFEALTRANPKSPGASVNLFSARLHRAQELDASVREEYIEDALRQWHTSERQLSPESRERIAATAWFNTLLALSELGRTREFDDSLESLAPSFRYSQAIVGLAISVWNEIGARARAVTLLDAAETHHGSAAWINQLRQQVEQGLSPAPPLPAVAPADRPPSILELRAGYSEALLRTPDDIASIFGDPGEGVEGFLRRNHIAVAEDMLLLEATLVELRDEDKYNHIYAKLLAGRLGHLYWTVAEGTPGGRSDGSGAVKGTAGGEGWRDWIVQARGRDICVGEALRCRGVIDEAQINEHVNKLALYDSVGRPFAFVVAFLELTGFDAAVGRYRDVVSTTIFADFPLARIDPSAEVVGARLRAFKSFHMRGDTLVTVHHILIGLPRSKT